MKTTAVILAAGHGVRMHSKFPKVLHSLLGKPMVEYSLDAAQQASGSQPVLVVGHQADAIRQVVGEAAQYVIQEPQLGTGHAVQQAESLLQGRAEYVLVMTADMPLLTPETLQKLIQAQREHTGPVSMLTIKTDDSRGFGRVVRSPEGDVQAVVEEAHATPEQLAIREMNAGVYCFTADWLWGALPRIPLSPKGEYYLTDLVGIAVQDGMLVQALTTEDITEAIGINTRVHLAQAGAVLKQRINQHWMSVGVTIVDPLITFIDSGVIIGQDTTIWPNTYLQGDTVIGDDCTIGPNAIIRDTQIGNCCQVLVSVLESAVLEDDVDVGPFGHLRKGAHLAQGVHMGNFGEVKDSYLGPGTKMGHFSYVGNATIESGVNIGAGVVTCNYDGKEKHSTEIGEGVFVGSDTMLVAPVKIGDRARTGAGSVVTKDVPPDTLAVGAPARAIRKLENAD
ncbi:MAG: bifunctional UDP-N-acetylglucosamine diphosphorylase/glucosamine-1-phosphate N-acetyltransferase GlmU [Anaerolineales bacterium]|nr:bifunctional UDP-N-acetylglucosamine diphosphorylase/glucosamine-1-phosphate N-acetyltransferase GlmU [Anaerolineales bacterium]